MSIPRSWTWCTRATCSASRTASSRATANSSGGATCSTKPASKSRWRRRGTTIGTELERFAANTLEYIQQEARLTFEPLELPPLDTKFAGRHALVVVRGHDYRSDLAALRPYIREYRPVLIGVDGGADALLEHRSEARHHHR